jgi:hypothetical protein
MSSIQMVIFDIFFQQREELQPLLRRKKHEKNIIFHSWLGDRYGNPWDGASAGE